MHLAAYLIFPKATKMAAKIRAEKKEQAMKEAAEAKAKGVCVFVFVFVFELMLEMVCVCAQPTTFA